MDTEVPGWLDGIRQDQPLAMPPRVTFRPGEGGNMPLLWAEYMLNLWWAARDKKLAFSEAVKQTTVHFMVGDQP